MEIKKNIGLLHIVRGLAALLVTIGHAKWPFWVGGAAYLQNSSFGDLSMLDKLGFILAMITGNGTAMVIVFYVLSGFLISYSYEKNKWKYDEFLINRCIRIYIPFIASLILAVVLIVLAYKINPLIYETSTGDFGKSVRIAYREGLTLDNLVKTFFFYRSEANYIGFNFVYWSLLYEGIFYLIFPLLIRYIKTFTVISILIFPLQFFFSPDEMNFFYFYFLSKFLIYFCMGIYLFKLVTDKKIEKLYNRRLLTLFCIPILFLVVVILGLTKLKLISFLFAGLLCMMAIFYILRFGVKQTWLTNRLVGLGEISYSLYLIHVPLYVFFYALVGYLTGYSSYKSPWIHYIFVAAALPVAYLFYQVFEKRSLRWIKRYKEKVNRKKTQIAKKDLQVNY